MYGLIYDAESIRKLLMDFYQLTGINISFASFDYKYVVSLPRIDNSFCKKLREYPCMDKKCLECDKIAFHTAEKTRDFHIYECHAGLTEAISPVIDNGRIIGYLFMGKVLMEKPTKEVWDRIKRNFKDYDLDLTELERQFYKCPSLVRKKIEAAARIMDISAKYICLTKLAKLKSRPMIENIKEYIDNNLDKNVTTIELSKRFNISQSHLCHTVKQELGMTISEYRLHKKIERACELLETTQLPVKEIAYTSGFNDQNFFAREFKKLKSCTPTQYRIELKK